jgi:hypothetical protein
MVDKKSLLKKSVGPTLLAWKMEVGFKILQE